LNKLKSDYQLKRKKKKTKYQMKVSKYISLTLLFPILVILLGPKLIVLGSSEKKPHGHKGVLQVN
jgi:hypothetical protein